MNDPADLRREMVDDLTASGELDPAWRQAFLAVPRHGFIPDLIWHQERGELVPFRRADDPVRWLRLAYAPRQFLITQVDDGDPVGPGLIGDRISSSASQPDARRGTYRVIYLVDLDRRTVQVLDIDHRSTVYRRR